MGSYQATMIAGQTLEFTIPAPSYGFQVTNIGALGGATVFATSDGTQPVVPSPETVTAGTQVGVPAGAGPVKMRGPMPGSGTPGPAGPAGSPAATVLLLSSGTPTVLVEW